MSVIDSVLIITAFVAAAWWAVARSRLPVALGVWSLVALGLATVTLVAEGLHWQLVPWQLVATACAAAANLRWWRLRCFRRSTWLANVSFEGEPRRPPRPLPGFSRCIRSSHAVLETANTTHRRRLSSARSDERRKSRRKRRNQSRTRLTRHLAIDTRFQPRTNSGKAPIPRSPGTSHTVSSAIG